MRTGAAARVRQRQPSQAGTPGGPAGPSVRLLPRITTGRLGSAESARREGEGNEPYYILFEDFTHVKFYRYSLRAVVEREGGSFDRFV